jgi:hypothetical protein
MNRTLYISLLITILGLSLFVHECPAFELNSRYATITYHNQKTLKEFNTELYMGTLRSMVKRQGPDTIEEEVVAKINVIVEKAMAVLDMYPAQLKFSIVIEPDEESVQQHFQRLYKIDVNYIAFYSPGKNRVFYSADNGRLRVVTHEIGHVIVENYFKVSPPQKIHEVLAQYAEKHIND